MRKVKIAVARRDELTEDQARIVSLGDDGGECAVVLHKGVCYAVGSLCPHQNALLANAPTENGQIVCLRHGYRFDLKTGDCRTIGGYGLPVYEAEIENDMVYVSYWKYE